MAGVYVHIPFCRQRCSYCDFYFVTGSKKVVDFIEALKIEIAATPDSIAASEISTVYFGGGTPSRLIVTQLESILDSLHSRFNISADAECTIEINPEDGSLAYLKSLREAGFNRLSIGIQSLKDSDLSFMRRLHTSSESRQVLERARKAGFESFSIDLIFGLPEQTATDWQTTLDFAVKHEVPHISTYGLTVEPKTILAKWDRDGKVHLPDADRQLEFYERTMEVLTGAGYEHYEISSFCRPGARSRHNASYWDHTDYLGFGPSAHSFRWGESPRRWSNVRSLRRYLENPLGGRDTDILDRKRLAVERIMLGLRTADGVSLDELENRYGVLFNEPGKDKLEQFVLSALLQIHGRRLTLTKRGMGVADAIASHVCDADLLESIR